MQNDNEQPQWHINGKLQRTTCTGCLDEQPNQLAHMGNHGCLEEPIYSDTDSERDSDNEYMDYIIVKDEDEDEDEEVIPQFTNCFTCDFPIEVYMTTNERSFGKRAGTPIETPYGTKWNCSKCVWGETKWKQLIKTKQKGIWPCKVCNSCGLKENGYGNCFTYTREWDCDKCTKIHKIE